MQVGIRLTASAFSFFFFFFFLSGQIKNTNYILIKSAWQRGDKAADFYSYKPNFTSFRGTRAKWFRRVIFHSGSEALNLTI